MVLALLLGCGGGEDGGGEVAQETQALPGSGSETQILPGDPRLSDLDFLLAQSDYVVLCLPQTPESRGLINREAFKKMKPGAFLINVSRGGLVDYADLKEALRTGQIAGAGLDVFWQEPPDPEDDIFRYNIMATPHIGGATDISMQGIAQGVAQNIRRVAQGRTPLNLANG